MRGGLVLLVLVAPRVLRAPEGPAAREARRPHCVRRRASKPARALRALRRPPHQWGRVAVNIPARPRHRPRAPQPGPASKPARALRSLHTSGACCAEYDSPRLEARPGPATAHGNRSQARHRPRALRPGRRGYCASSTFACNSSVTISVFELASLELQRFWTLLKVHAIELHAEFLLCVSVVTRGQWSLVQRLPRMLCIRIGCCYLDRL